MRKVMAVASGGGHWVELRRIMPAFAGTDVFYVSTEAAADADAWLVQWPHLARPGGPEYWGAVL